MKISREIVVAAAVGAIGGATIVYASLFSQAVRVSKLKDFTNSECKALAKSNNSASAGDLLSSLGDFNSRASDAGLSKKERDIAFNFCMTYSDAYSAAFSDMTDRLTR